MNKSVIDLVDGGILCGIIQARQRIAVASRAIISVAVVLSVLGLFLPLADAAENSNSSTAASGSQAKPDQKSKSAANRITEAAVKAGILSCADRIDQVTNFITTGSRSGAILFESPSEPDKRLVSISLGLAMKGGKIAYASESFAPNQANGCGGMYETVVYWETGCDDVAKRQFSAFKKFGVLVNSITVLDGGAGVRVFLMPAGTGCVAIKKEVLN